MTAGFVVAADSQEQAYYEKHRGANANPCYHEELRDRQHQDHRLAQSIDQHPCHLPAWVGRDYGDFWEGTSDGGVNPASTWEPRPTLDGAA